MSEATQAASTAPFGYRRATILACVLCGLLTLISLLVPPAVNFDPGIGMMEWRALTEGGPANSIVAPDPANISQDVSERVPWWSPGQYLLPGALTRLGLRLGPALSILVGLCLLSCLIGWIRVFKHFACSPQTTLLAVAFLSAFQYSTTDFRIYLGGEILLQAVVPWLILAGCQVPLAGAIRAAVLAGVAILIAFFMKLTGVLVAVAALGAGSVVVLIRLRRITPGMVGGAIGALLALWLLYETWYSHGPTVPHQASWAAQWGKVVFAAVAPWGAGVSWLDMWEDVSFALGHPLQNLSSMNLVLVPPMLLFAAALAWGAATRTNARSKLHTLIKFTACFYAIYVIAMGVLFLRGLPISIEERHLRSAGTLIFVCAFAVADRFPGRHAVRLAVVGFCGCMALYGVYDFVHRIQAVHLGSIDPYSRTRQLRVDPRALEYARDAFAHEGRNALFVIPFPDAANGFPPGARLMLAYLDVQSEAYLAERNFAGRVPGDVYILLRTPMAQSSKGALLLQGFTDYSPDGWDTHILGGTTVLVHAPPPQ